MNTITERLQKFMAFAGLNPNQVTVECGLSVGLIGKAIKKNGGLNSDTIEKILRQYPSLNPEWLVMDQGEMLQTKSKKNLTDLNGKENSKENGNKRNVEKTLPIISEPELEYGKIPLYDGVVIAGQKSVADLSPQTLPVGYINAGDWFKDATGAMQVYDDSMTEYPTGSYVCFRQLQDRQLIIYGQDYVIETKEYRVIKKIQRSEKEGYILLASTNQDLWENGPLAGRMIHEPFEVFMDSIINICRVLGAVNRKESVYLYK